MELTIIHPITRKPLHGPSGAYKAFPSFIPVMLGRDEEQKKWVFNLGMHLAMLTSNLEHGCYVPLLSIGNATGYLRIMVSFFRHSFVLWLFGEKAEGPS